jgi:intraflagellar transport protein 56
LQLILTLQVLILHHIALHCMLSRCICCNKQAFDVLERLDPDPEYWEGKRGACVGVFQQVIAGKANKDDLRDVLSMVRNTSNPQVEYMVRVIKKWCKDNGMKIA